MKLREVCDITSGQNAPQASSDYQIGGKTFIKVSDLDNVIFDDNESRSCKVTDSAIKEYKLKLFPAGSIIFAKSGLSCVKNRVYLLKRPSYIVNHICILYNFKIQINHLWLLYYLKAFNVTKLIKDFSYPSIKLSEIGGIDVPAIPLEKQNKIVEEITQLSNICKNRLSELNSFDELIKSRFIEMFGEPDENPFNWEVVTINDVCSSIVRGPFGSALKKEFFVEKDDSTVKVYEQQHAIKKNANIGSYYITQERYKTLKRFECVAGDIIMSCSGTMGELYQLPAGCEKGIINQALCKFTLNKRMLPRVFLESMKYVVEQMDKKGSGIQNIAAVSYIKAMKLCLPPIDIQNKFVNFYEVIDKSKFVVQQQIKDLKELLDKKMDEYFGG